mgnify:CR=1
MFFEEQIWGAKYKDKKIKIEF